MPGSLRDPILFNLVVANCRMNRERTLTGTNGYSHELGFHPLDWLRERLAQQTGTVRRQSGPEQFQIW
jgi:hypothetical protein